MISWRRRNSFVGAVLLAAGIALTYACSDLTNPRRALKPTAPVVRNWDQPDVANTSLSVDATNGSGSVDVSVSYPVQTVVNVIASGYVVQHDNFGYYPDFNWGPGSRAPGLPAVVVDEAFANGTATAIGFNYNNNQATDTLTIVMTPGTSLYKVQRGLTSGLRRWPWYINNQYVYCDTWTNPPCYTFSGSYSISIVAPSATFTAHADSSTYAVGSTATISMTRAPLTVSGNSTPMQVDSALWQAAPDSLGGDAADTMPLNGCSSYRWVGTDYVCNHSVNGSGTLTMIGHANGYRVSAPVPISISGPTLKLTATPSADLVTGDTVNFSPSWSDGYQINVTGWKWLADSVPNLISQDGGDCPSTDVTCRRPIRQSGTMYVTVLRDGKHRTAHVKLAVTIPPLQLTATPTSVNLGQSVQFTASAGRAPFTVTRWSFAQGPAICGASPQCSFAPSDSGTMWVYALVGPHADSAKASIIVTDPNDESQPPVAQLKVACFFPGGSSTRGQSVRCETSINPDSLAFQVVRREGAEKMLVDFGRSPPYSNEYSVITETTDTSVINVAPHSKDSWEGPALLETTVKVTATVSGTTITGTAKFTPTPRPWTRWHWNESISEKHDSVMNVGGYATPDIFQPFPVNGVGQSTTTGIFLPQPPDTSTYDLSTVTGGPNAGFWYARSQSPNPSYKLYVHPWLRRPTNLPLSYSLRDSVIAWQNRQNGGGIDTSMTPNRPWCDGAGIDSIFGFSKRHEGWTHATNSHWGIGDSVFAAFPIHSFFEEYSDVASGAKAKYKFLYFVWFYNYGAYVDPEKAYDQDGGTEYTAVSQICSFKP